MQQSVAEFVDAALIGEHRTQLVGAPLSADASPATIGTSRWVDDHCDPGPITAAQKLIEEMMQTMGEKSVKEWVAERLVSLREYEFERDCHGQEKGSDLREDHKID